MNKILPFLFILSLLTGCDSKSKKEIDFNDFLTYDKKTKKLTIDFKKVDKYDIKWIELKTKKNLIQSLYLDSMKQIEQIENGLKVGKLDFFRNTWYTFDRQGSLNNDYSFYYDSYMLSNHIDSFYVTYDILFNLYGGEHYAVVGEYDEYFNLKKNAKVDTVWQEKDSPLIKIPVQAKKMKSGKQNVRFIVFEDKIKDDTVWRKRTYVDRDYFIEFKK